VSGELPTPAALPLEKEPPVRAGWAPEPVWKIYRGEKLPFLPDLNSSPLAVQPVASHYIVSAS
jgi:hypothetical protein